MVDVMDLAKIVLESVKKDGHLDDLLPVKDASGVAVGEPAAEGATAVVFGSAPAPAALPEAEDLDTISAAANYSCNNPTQTVASTDTLLQARATPRVV